MTDDEGQQVMRKPKRRSKTKLPAAVPLDIAETFDVANAKDKDFDLDLDAAKYQGKKGQAGSRTKAVDGGDTPAGGARSDQ